MDVFDEGVYIPSEEEVEKCSNGISCEFGICSECSVGQKERGEN